MFRQISLSLLCIGLWTISCGTLQHSSSGATAVDIEGLIAKMSIEEKVGQMTQINLDVICEGGIYQLVEPHHIEATKLATALDQWHVGSILNCGGHAYPLEQWHTIIGEIQSQSKAKNRIPILYGIDAIHGANYVMGSTLFPQQLAQAATFDPALSKEAARITAYETRAAGIPWNFSPVLDVARNPNWSRYFETFGEDPLVCSRFGKAMVEGYQGNANEIDAYHVAACMKHFLGYSGARTGKDRTPAYIPEIELREIYLPSFQAAIASGALSVMINSGEINGIPVHANPVILTQLLRNELKFEGVAVTDWEDVMKLHQIHRVSGSMKESVQMAVDAGIDMCMVPNDFEFAKYLIELVKEGSIKEERLNISVRRILQMKQKLGLFSDAFTPAKNTYALFGSVSHQEAALNAAQESITLLKNEQAILPLKKSQKILVTGPAAQSKTLLNGAWTRTWQGVDEKYDEERQTTVVAAMRQYAGEQVLYAEGCSIDQITDAEWALKQAALADVIVVCLSEKPSTEKPGDITSLRLDAAQRDYVKMLHKTGKPLVLVLIENRPRIIEDIAGLAQGIVMGYLPGDQGAKALTQILYGEVNPSGKLPFTYPRDEQSLILYDHKYTEELDVQFQFNAFQPQWPFGYGLSYSPIVYSNLRVSTSEFGANQSVTVSVTVSNQSSRVAKESVLLFSRDHVASITPSVRRLRDFTKITLQPNESKTVQFEINASDLQFIGKNLIPTIEPGAFDLMIQNLVTTINYKP